MQGVIKFAAIIMTLLLCKVGAVHADAVSGSFIYTEEHNQASLMYTVQDVEYQGVPAWKVTWKHPQIDAKHYIRQSDSMPLYVKRINRVLKQTVEIIYSTKADKPHLYSRKTKNNLIEKKIWRVGLRDLGTLPQLLLGLKANNYPENITFSAIQYSDGEVYDLIARKKSFRHIRINGSSHSGVIYHININSWLSIIFPHVKITLPRNSREMNFITYSGPNLADTGTTSTFHFSHKVSELAEFKQ